VGLGHAPETGKTNATPLRDSPVACETSSQPIFVGLSLRAVLPTVPMAATLSAAQLAAFVCPAGLHHLLIAQDNDPVGRAAAATLCARATEAGLMAVVLAPRRSDFNDDLRSDGAAGLMAHVRTQLERHGLGDLCPASP
jgi:hypothetical protein